MGERKVVASKYCACCNEVQLPKFVGIDSVEVGVVLSALTFVVVSRLTPPTPDKNLAVFFDG